MTSYEKAKYRKSKEWQDFRDNFRESHIDRLTEEPLKPKYVLHHSDLNPNNYKKLEPKNFMGFNTSYEHRMIHYLYTRYIKDPRIIMRLEQIIKEMVDINKWKDIKDFK